MATRLETERRRELLRAHLREASLRCSLSPREMVPPVRELATRFELSVPVTLEVVKGLAEEGVLMSVPSVGTFFNRSRVSRSDVYLLVHEVSGELDAIRVGFEDRISQLGSASLVISAQAAQSYIEREFQHVAGVFRARSLNPTTQWEAPAGIPQVEFGRVDASKPDTDAVYFDNEDGGVRATRHLMQLGHTRIAFLGLHGPRGATETFQWSQERAAGWASALKSGEIPSDDLLFLPPQTSGFDRNNQIDTARQASGALLLRSDVTGVVAANSFAARGLFEALQESKISEKQWPAVVTFDDYHVLDGFPVTALRLPWEEIGRAGAEMLWRRRQGQITGAPQQRLVPMRLIARLSCRPHWAHGLELASQHILTNSTGPAVRNEQELILL